MEMLDNLLAIDKALVDWLLHASPNTNEDRAKMRSLFAQRGDLDDAINGLVAYRLKLAVANLPADAAKLQDAANSMTAAAKDISDVQKIVTAVGTALEVAGKLTAFVTGAVP